MDVARAGALLNQVQYQTCVPSLEARELTKERRRNVVEYVVRVQAVRNVGRIHAETRLVSFGTLRPRNLERYKCVRQSVEITAPPAPGVGQAHVSAVTKPIVGSNVGLAIVCSPRVPHS